MSHALQLAVPMEGLLQLPHEKQILGGVGVFFFGS